MLAKLLCIWQNKRLKEFLMPIFRESDFSFTDTVPEHVEEPATESNYDKGLWSIRETLGSEAKFMAVNIYNADAAYDLVVARLNKVRTEGLQSDMNVVEPGRLRYAIAHEKAKRERSPENHNGDGAISDVRLRERLILLSIPENLADMLVADLSLDARDKYFEEV